MKRLLIVTLSLVFIGQIHSGCAPTYAVVDERSFPDRIVFTVVDPDGSVPLPGVEIFMVGPDWAKRIDVTDENGRWTISRTWLQDTEKLHFCWPKGPFECVVVDLNDISKMPSNIELSLPPPTFNHRHILVPERE